MPISFDDYKRYINRTGVNADSVDYAWLYNHYRVGTSPFDVAKLISNGQSPMRAYPHVAFSKQSKGPLVLALTISISIFLGLLFFCSSVMDAAKYRSVPNQSFLSYTINPAGPGQVSFIIIRNDSGKVLRNISIWVDSITTVSQTDTEFELPSKTFATPKQLTLYPQQMYSLMINFSQLREDVQLHGVSLSNEIYLVRNDKLRDDYGQYLLKKKEEQGMNFSLP